MGATEYNEGLDRLIAALTRQHNAYVANGLVLKARHAVRVIDSVERKRIR